MAKAKTTKNDLLVMLQRRRDELPPNLKEVCRKLKGRENIETENNWDNWGNSSSFPDPI